MDHTTYAIEDMNVVAAHPAMGQMALNGKGLVSVTFGRSTDMSAHDVAGDGSVMVSKIPGKNGLVTIVAQQTSAAARWLTRWINYVESAPPEEFTGMTITASSKTMGKSHTATGVSPQKMPDKVFGAQGAQESYPAMAQEIEEGVA